MYAKVNSLSVVVVMCTLITSMLFLASCAANDQAESSKVSKAEYYAAAQAAAECLNKKGFEAAKPEEDFAGLYTIGLETKPGDDTSTEEAGLAAMEKCWSKHAASVEKKYAEGLALSGEAWEADYREMISCLESAGISGVKVGDEEGVVGEAIGLDNEEGVLCIQAHLYQLFQEGAGK